MQKELNKNFYLFYVKRYYLSKTTPIFACKNKYNQPEMFYSVIIPVYNRPDEVDELLDSLTSQTYKEFEVIVVEDGSSIPCKEVVDRYNEKLDIKYFSKANSGPGQTRNYGAERSKGDYLIILDSDCILPPGYFNAVEKELKDNPADAFGGPDKAHDSFTNIQKAINYAMTSFFTTGGIRGGKKKMDKFYPVVLIWASNGKYMKRWEAFLKCGSEKISISVSVSSKEDTNVGFFPMLGYTINAAQI